MTTKTYLFDFSKVLLFAKDTSYTGDLNPKYHEIKDQPNFDFFSNFKLNTQLLEFLKQKSSTVNMYIFTSGSIQKDPALVEHLSFFKGIFSAEKLGLNKKEPSSFIKIAELIDKQPEEITFIDDSATNIQAATQAGFQAIQYQSNEQVIKQLNS